MVNLTKLECGNCGGIPMGTGCYNLCFNSPFYYSPEQERADEPHYGDDDNRERYAATVEPSQYADPYPYDGDHDIPLPATNPVVTEDFGTTKPNDQDVPF